MKIPLVLAVGFLVVLAAGAGIAWSRGRQEASMRELGLRLDALSHEVSTLRAQLAAGPSSEITSIQRDAILAVIAEDRAEQKRQGAQTQEQRFLQFSVAHADSAAKKFGLTDDQRNGFAEVLRLGRDKMEAADAQLADSLATADLDASVKATQDVVRGFEAWRLEELTKRLGADLARKMNKDVEFGALGDWSRLEASKKLR